MPNRNPKFYRELLNQAEENRGTLIVGKKGALEILYKESGELRVSHFNTLILLANIPTGKIVSTGGAYSQTDSRYINATLNYFGLDHAYRARIVQGELTLTENNEYA